MNMRTLLSLVVIAVSLGTLGSAIADDMDAMPEVKTQNGISYVSGGIGKDQSDAMNAAAKDYTLMLTCATRPTGEYLADVKVNITDKSGSPVLETVTDGPILLVKLAPGQYRISAESNGGSVNKTVNISAKHPVKVNLYWPADAAQPSAKDPRL
jgi:hypothetical protein